MNNDEKKLIFMLFIVIWCFFGEGIFLAFWDLQTGIMVFIFFAVGIGLLLKLSKTNFAKILYNYRAQRKGKMFYGYIFQIIERNENENNVIDNVIEMHPNTEKKEMMKLLRKITGSLILKIIIYDDIKKETVYIEQEVSTATVINENISEQQCIRLYQYKNKYHMLTDNCVVPKFLIPREYRFEIKKHLDKYSAIN